MEKVLTLKLWMLLQEPLLSEWQPMNSKTVSLSLKTKTVSVLKHAMEIFILMEASRDPILY